MGCVLERGSDCVACRLTAAGRGAIAVVGVFGPDSHSLIQACFEPATALAGTHFPIDSIRYGVWIGSKTTNSLGDAGKSGESVVVCATSNNAIEVHCHGGKAAVAAVLEDLQQAGAKVIDQAALPQFLNDSCVESDMHTDARVSLERLLQSTNTQTTAGIVLSQLRGSLRNECQQIVGLLRENGEGSRQAAVDRLSRLVSFRPVAKHLVVPWNIVIAGPPNVGKSSLLNRILGYQRAITYDAPGTTRDIISTEAAIGGWPVRISDTAGLRSGEDDIESKGVSLAIDSLRAADLVLLTIDACEGLTATHEIIASHAQCPVLVVVNKVDLIADRVKIDRAGERQVAVSATTGEGFETLLDALLETLMPVRPEVGEGVPIFDWQYQILDDSIKCEDIGEMVFKLSSLC